MKLTYAEQLRHPMWQQKRLEVLAASGWKCAGCGSTEQTLHVHHKHYVKGRLAWEYQASELVSLCEQCHALAHQRRAMLLALLAQVEPVDRAPKIGEGSATLLVLGFLANDIHDFDLIDRFGHSVGSRSCNAGNLARQAVNSGLSILEIAGLADLIGDPRWLPRIKGLIEEAARNLEDRVAAESESSGGAPA